MTGDAESQSFDQNSGIQSIKESTHLQQPNRDSSIKKIIILDSSEGRPQETDCKGEEENRAKQEPLKDY